MIEGYNGSGVVIFLVILLWMFAAYRFWIVWTTTLNFEEVKNKKRFNFIISFCVIVFVIPICWLLASDRVFLTSRRVLTGISIIWEFTINRVM